MDKKRVIRIAIYVVVAIVAIWILWRLGKKIYDKIQSNKNARGLEGSIVTSELTYDAPQYKSFAKTLYEAMKGPGTDEDKVAEVFKQMNSRSDVLMLKKEYGVIDGQTLDEWIDDDFSASGKEEYINKILRTKSIQYVF